MAGAPPPWVSAQQEAGGLRKGRFRFASRRDSIRQEVETSFD